MIKRIFLMISVLILLCGCSAQKTQEEVVFSSWGSVSEVKVIKKLISDFERENSDIKIKFIHVPQNYFQKIHLLFASNTAPDVIFINNYYLPVYENLLEDLSQITDKDDYYSQVLEALSYNGKLLAVPRDASNLLFYVNLDILKKHNLTLPKENWSLSDLLNYSKIITTKGIFGVSYEDNIYWALPYLNYFGGGILSEDANKNIIDSPKSLRGLNFYKSLKSDYHVAPQKSDIGSSTLAQMFLDEKICFYLSGRWMYPKISEQAGFNWAVINFPKGAYGIPCDASGWAISKASKHKDSAKKFVQYLSDKKSSEYFTKTGLTVPARKSVSVLLNNDIHNEKMFLKVLENSVKNPVNKDYKKITDEINRKIEL